MIFERVLMVWDYYDQPRTGLVSYEGLPFYFRCEFDEEIDEYSDTFELLRVSDEFLEIAEKIMKIFREWETDFYQGLVSHETHPGHRGINSEYDKFDDWLREAVKRLEPLPEKFVPRFQALPDQDHLPVGMRREL